jgi:hypothetical protein
MPDGRADKLRRLGAGRSYRRRSQRLKAIRPDIGSWKKRNLGELSSKSIDVRHLAISGPAVLRRSCARANLAERTGTRHSGEQPGRPRTALTEQVRRRVYTGRRVRDPRFLPSKRRFRRVFIEDRFVRHRTLNNAQPRGR